MNEKPKSLLWSIQPHDNLIILLRRLRSLPYLAGCLSFLAGIIYLVQSVIYLYGQRSMNDEGAYLYQGFLFAKNLYQPFQNYGFWQYMAPLLLYNPGICPGMVWPRSFSGAVFCTFSGSSELFWESGLLPAVWEENGGPQQVFCSRFESSKYKDYSLAVTQVLVACMLTWVIVLELGEKRPVWQIVTGSILSGLISINPPEFGACFADPGGLHILAKRKKNWPVGSFFKFACCRYRSYYLLAQHPFTLDPMDSRKT